MQGLTGAPMSKARLLSSDCRPVALHFHLLNSYSPTTYAQFTSPLVQLPNLCAHIQATERGGSCCALAVSIPSPLTLSTMSYANCRTQTKCLHAGKLTSTPLESFFLLCATMVECIHVFSCTIPPSQSVDGNKLIRHRSIRLETPATSSWCRTAGYQLPIQCPALVCLSPLLILREETRDYCLSISVPQRTGWHLLATLWLFSKQSQEKGTQGSGFLWNHHSTNFSLLVLLDQRCPPPPLPSGCRKATSLAIPFLLPNALFQSNTLRLEVKVSPQSKFSQVVKPKPTSSSSAICSRPCTWPECPAGHTCGGDGSGLNLLLPAQLGSFHCLFFLTCTLTFSRLILKVGFGNLFPPHQEKQAPNRPK